MPTQLIVIKRYALTLCSLWTVIVAASFAWQNYQQKNNVYEIARAEARIAFQKDMLYRKWATQHGGVYVPATPETPPNPYLSHLPERDISTPSGKPLTLVNPAYMTRQVFELANVDSIFVKGHITSLNPIRKENAPDQWEQAALETFDKGAKEASIIQVVDGQSYIRLMRPFVVEQPCLKCHAQQGYKVGDIRGGISVSVPLSVFAEISDRLFLSSLSTHFLIWLLGTGLITFGSRKLYQGSVSLHEKNLQLETEVTERQKKQEQLDVKAALLENEVAMRKQSEEAIRRSEAALRKVQAVARMGSWTWYPESKQLEWSEEMYLLFGIDNSSAAGVANETVSTVMYPEVLHMVEKANLSVSRDGKPVPVEYHVVWQDKSEHIIWAEVGERVLDESGQLVALSGYAQDITERKQAQAETQKLEAQLHQSQKMESVGRLAGGVAHDFNNMLGVIIGHTELALMEMTQSQPCYSSIVEIRNAADRSAALTRQLLAFASKQTIAPRLLDLNDTVSGMLKMLQRLIGEDIQLTWKPSPNLWPVKLDPSQIDQILANLCVNARDAISDVGKITIETGNSTFDRFYCAANPGFSTGDYVLIEVSDDGCGMDRETMRLIFEPFFTTKGIGQGTGLGLATVYGIIKQNNGFINVYSEPGQGTTFKIYLPRHNDKGEPVSVEDCSKPLSRGRETILLVEDELAILKMTKLLLEKQGYTVLPAGTPSEAVSLAMAHSESIQLLMTDVIMPRMNGRDLAHKLLLFCPQIKCLFMSGYTANVIAQHGVLDEDVYFLQKPFSIQKLAAKVREVLDN